MNDNKFRQSAYGLRNPIQKLSGLPIIAKRNPTVNDKKFPKGTLWINEILNTVYSLTSTSVGSAIWVQLSAGTVLPEIETLTADSGGAVGPDGAFNVNILGGAGISAVGVPGTNTITISTTSVVTTWTREAGTSVAMAVDRGYIPTNVALTTLTLPPVAEVGDFVEVCGEGTAGWTIAQNALQNIQAGKFPTSVGIGGSLSSTNQFDTIRIICRVANTTWSMLDSTTSNFIIV